MEHDSPTPASRRVEAYLDIILAPLARRLSPSHREELRRELREHLWARIDAYGELGQSEEGAVTEALCQFGGAEDFTRQWRREWTKTPPRVTVREVWEAARPALCLSVPALSLTWLAGHLLACLVRAAAPTSYSGALMIVYGEALFQAAGWLAFVLLPLALGLAAGSRGGRRAGLGMFAALAFMVFTGGLLCRFGVGLWPEHPLAGGFFTSLPLIAALWMVPAYAAAVAGGWLTRRRKGGLA